MSDNILKHYEQELAFIRKSSQTFAKTHPKVAGRLKLGGENVEDPHVSRLLEGIAYLNAHVQQKLQDDLPELSDGILSVLYPHYQCPIPSTSIVQFSPDPELDSIFKIPAQTQLETAPFQGETCQFSTIYPVNLMPIIVKQARVMARPFVAPGAAKTDGAAVLQVQLNTTVEELSFTELESHKIRFYLNGQPQHIHQLYHLLLNQTNKVVLARSESDPHPIFLDPSCIKAVGFEPNEGLLPYPKNAFLGYRLLTEFFTCAEKFLFVEFDLSDKIDASWDDELQIYCYLKQSDIELERSVDPNHFALGCTPVINLFKQSADPILVDQRQTEYHVITDLRRPHGLEIYQIEKVTGTTAEGDTIEFSPFYHINHSKAEEDPAFWYARREYSDETKGTEMYLSLVDLNFSPHTNHPDLTLEVATTMFNRDLPSKLPFGGGQPKLFSLESSLPVTQISCLTAPTHTIMPPMKKGAYWRLISHLNLNHLSLADDGELSPLKEILSLYNFSEAPSINTLINAISKVEVRPVTLPLTLNGFTTPCRGTQVKVEFDENLLAGSSAFLFASVLERFLGLYCHINTFIQMIATIKGKEGILKTWPPRAGEQQLI